MLNKDEIIRMAQEAGFCVTKDKDVCVYGDFEINKPLIRFAALVAQNYMAKACGGCVIKQCYKRMDAEIESAVLAEREACAKVCDDLHHWAASCCSKDIRARGE